MCKYYRITQAELGQNSKIPIVKLGDSGEVYYELALEMIKCIEDGNLENRHTTIICPVGPTGQYPIFVRLVNARGINLKNCTIINMDEYLKSDGSYITKKTRLSFRGYMDNNVYSKINPDLIMPQSARVFPDPKAPQKIGEIIRAAGGVDLAIGGIGINGHIAFNEPDSSLTPEEFAKTETRVLKISEDTRTTNAIAALGGALELMPEYCVTLGMKEILSAKRVRIGMFRDWHRAVIRRAAYGEVTAQFGATLLQNHADAIIYANNTATADVPVPL